MHFYSYSSEVKIGRYTEKELMSKKKKKKIGLVVKR